MTIELLVAMGSSDDRRVPCQSSTTLALCLALDLRRDRTSSVYTIILQRLTSSPSLVVNFTAFVGDKGRSGI